jgi:dipeptidase E
MATPIGIDAYLASNLDITGAAVRGRIPLNGARVLLVPTATYGEGRTLKPEKAVPYWDAGASVAVLDIAQHGFSAVATALHNADVVHICGGNTFHLLDAAQRCRLGDALAWRGKTADESGRSFAVVGESAGTILFGPDIGFAAGMDDPTVAPRLASTAGLGWMDALVVPHYKGELYGLGALVDAWLATEPDPARYTLLRDDQFFHLHAGTQTLDALTVPAPVAG